MPTTDSLTMEAKSERWKATDDPDIMFDLLESGALRPINVRGLCFAVVGCFRIVEPWWDHPAVGWSRNQREDRFFLVVGDELFEPLEAGRSLMAHIRQLERDSATKWARETFAKPGVAEAVGAWAEHAMRTRQAHFLRLELGEPFDPIPEGGGDAEGTTDAVAGGTDGAARVVAEDPAGRSGGGDPAPTDIVAP